MPYVDPRLNRHLRDVHDEILIDSIFIISGHDQDLLEGSNDDRLIKQILDQVIAETNYRPSFIRFIPRASAITLTASTKFINSLINHPCIQIASSATIDPFYF